MVSTSAIWSEWTAFCMFRTPTGDPKKIPEKGSERLAKFLEFYNESLHLKATEEDVHRILSSLVTF